MDEDPENQQWELGDLSNLTLTKYDQIVAKISNMAGCGALPADSLVLQMGIRMLPSASPL